MDVDKRNCEIAHEHPGRLLEEIQDVKFISYILTKFGIIQAIFLPTAIIRTAHAQAPLSFPPNLQLSLF